MYFKKAQSILDYVLVFIVVSGLLLGIVRIWIWFNANYAKRQVSFQKTRIDVAGPTRPYDMDNSLALVGVGYQPLDLTEDWVFKGVPSGKVNPVAGGDISLADASEACDTDCKNMCAGSDSCYQPCLAKCICSAQIQPAVNNYESQAVGLENQAVIMKKNSDDMYKQSRKCDNWWESCSWFGGKKSSREMKNAAAQLAKISEEFYDSATAIRNTIQSMIFCCSNNSDTVSQSTCLDALEE